MTRPELNGTIIKGVGGLYTVDTPQGLFICNARGLFRKQQISPIIGDHVTFIADLTDQTGMLSVIQPRRNQLRRPRVANVDRVIITVAAAQPELNLDLLDKYLLLAEHEAISSVICINKSDLLPDHALEDIFKMYQNVGYPIVAVSAETGGGLDALYAIMEEGISVLAGPSGVGKSSLINCLMPDAARETGELSLRLNRGKHTTRHTEILPLGKAGYVIDTPGFTSLDLSAIPPEERAALFIEFRPFLGLCRFSDCRHDTESDCAIKNQVGRAIPNQRYLRYLSLIR